LNTSIDDLAFKLLPRKIKPMAINKIKRQTIFKEAIIGAFKKVSHKHFPFLKEN